MLPAVEVQSLNHWTAREVPKLRISWPDWVFIAVQGLSLVVVRGLLIEVASLAAEQWTLGVQASVVEACRL